MTAQINIAASRTAVAAASEGLPPKSLRSVGAIESGKRAQHETSPCAKLIIATPKTIVAQRDERVDRTLRQPIDELLEKFD
jgi:hypothetical protein